MTSPFTYKGYGRIYVKKEEDIKKVENILKSLDEFEFDYYPEGLVTTLDYYPNVIYVGKYEPNFNIEDECISKGIQVFVFDAKMSYCPAGYYQNRPLTKEEISALMTKSLVAHS